MQLPAGFDAHYEGAFAVFAASPLAKKVRKI